jgi:hypothetical protein
MKEKQESSRRNFIKKLTTTTAAVAVGNSLFASQSAVKPFAILKRQLGYEYNDQINIALIGAGGMGNSDTDTALKSSGCKIGCRLRFVRWPP